MDDSSDSSTAHSSHASKAMSNSTLNSKTLMPITHDKENDVPSFQNQALFEQSPNPNNFSRLNSSHFINYNPQTAMANISNNEFNFISTSNALIDEDTRQSF